MKSQRLELQSAFGGYLFLGGGGSGGGFFCFVLWVFWLVLIFFFSLQAPQQQLGTSVFLMLVYGK